MQGDTRDVLVVSHACVLAGNQDVYAHLSATRRVELVVPATWRDAYAPRGYRAQVAAPLDGHVHPMRVIGAGRPQRHAYLASCRSVLTRLGPAAVLIEEEPFSVAALQWSRAARRAGVPYGVQLAETKDRRLPRVVEGWRASVLRDAAFVVARSPAAASLATRWGATGEVAVVPHGVEEVTAAAPPLGPFTVAYVGRVVEDKGVGDLLEAARSLPSTVALLVAGDGPMSEQVRAAAARPGGAVVTALGAVEPSRIGEVYARAHVTCVPSRTTATWEEQFGRVVVESLVRGVPVIATSTGELPWVLGIAGGGTLVPERDPAQLAAAIAAMAADPDAARALGARGRSGVLVAFTNTASAGTLDELLDRVSDRRRPRGPAR